MVTKKWKARGFTILCRCASQSGMDNALTAAAEAVDFDIPEACVAGTIENRVLLDQHAARIRAFLDAHPDA